VVHQLLRAFPVDVRVVFKHYALPGHRDAKPAAIAAVAAQRQNKFWEMHDALFRNQRALDATSMRRYAQSIGLDMDRYDKDIQDPEIARFVDQEAIEARRAGVRGTPTFFVDGVRSPSWSFNTLRNLVEVARTGGDVGAAAIQVLTQLRQRQAQAPRRNRPRIDYNKVYEIDVAGSPVKGPADAPVTIISFGDYQ
jgi:protein-disulfide isomerase